MRESKFYNFLSDYFTINTCILALVLASLYFILGIQEGFLTGIWIIFGANILYVPFILIFKKKSFAIYNLAYALTLVFVLAFEKTFLFNNFSSLFLLCIVVLITPKLEIPAYTLYYIATSIAFLLNEESLVHYLIHIVRGTWFILIITVTIHRRYDRKKLILYDDEREILKQLCDGKVYQKEVEGFSENTIYRKLKAARERNGNITRDQLVDLYRKELDEQQAQK